MSTMKRYEQMGVAMTCRSYAEYERMFDLNDSELMAGRILDIAAGGSSFTAEMAVRGNASAVAVDPRYGCNVEQWVREAAEEIELSTSKLSKLTDVYDWSYYGTPERHRDNRLRSLALFEAHVRTSEGKEHYVAGSLPKLPFADDSFSLVLCSHFLFLYSEQFDERFHADSILEMMRVCKPGGMVKIYPLVSFATEAYPGLARLLEIVTKAGGTPELLDSKLPFIPGSQFYLRITI